MSETVVPDLNKTVGRTLFGKPARMDAGVWIATLSDEQAEGFWASQYACLSVKQGRGWVDIGPEIRRFEELGMVRQVAVDRVKVYARNPSPLWDIFCMVDVVLSEIRDPGSRKFFTPTPERVAAMIEDLRALREELAIGSE